MIGGANQRYFRELCTVFLKAKYSSWEVRCPMMFDLLLDVWTGTSCQATIAPSLRTFRNRL
jgi:hypothetical protein